MSTVAPASDQATDLLQKLSLDSQIKTLEVPEAKKKVNLKNSAAIQYGSVDGGEVPSGPLSCSERFSTPSVQDFMDPSMCYLPHGYPSTTYYYGGYDGPMNEWEDYNGYANLDGVEMPPPGVYGDMYHHGYGYAPYGAYTAAGSPVPTMGHDGQLYGPQHYQYPSYYQPPPTQSGAPYTFNQAATLQGGAPTSIAADYVPLHVGKGNGNVNGNENANNTSGPMPVKPSCSNSSQTSNGYYGRGKSQGNVPISRYQGPGFGFGGTQSSVPWLDGPTFSDGHPRMATSTVSSKVPSSRNQNLHPLPHLMGLNPRPASGMGPALGFMNDMYPNNRMYGHNAPGFSSNGFDSRISGRGWPAVEKYKSRGRGNGFFNYGNENADGLNELNRGPRAGRLKNLKGIPLDVTIAVKGQDLSSKSNDESSMIPDRDQYNQAEFLIKYSDAKFFIIKSYSEDDIHRSMKYSVWASTPNGNKKLDAAYREAEEKPSGCPVFLFFSVNTSGQFVGLAEMEGPVDFNKNLEFWQQDKWNGCFPIKWHIVKDVPNSFLKHIILENNDNKPVTNSRDTQEVKFDQGLEMLKIFKDHVNKTSMLDDFGFYESRQKALQERKAKSMQCQKQVSDGKPLKAAGNERERDLSGLKSKFQKPLESVQGHGNLVKENGLVVGAGDAPKGANPASEGPVVANGVPSSC